MMTPMERLVHASLEVHGLPKSDVRASEIVVEAERLRSGLSAHLPRLSSCDEPAHFAALLMREANDG